MLWKKIVYPKGTMGYEIQRKEGVRDTWDLLDANGTPIAGLVGKKDSWGPWGFGELALPRECSGTIEEAKATVEDALRAVTQ